jgi:2-phosphosulfolactate phosphatase
MKKTIDICLSPSLYHLYDGSDSIVVVIDVLRATSSICIAFHNGVRSIVPVATVEECRAYKEKGYLIAAERQGEMVEGFDMGNSPFSYITPDIKDKDIALTTTNGTQAIQRANDASQILIGSFLNLDALAKWLLSQNKSVICLCAGWKNAVNLEDSLFAGALSKLLVPEFGLNNHCDSVLMAMHLYDIAKNDMLGYLEQSSHRKRLQRLHIEKDVEYCMKPNQTDVVPGIVGNSIIDLSVLQSI